MRRLRTLFGPNSPQSGNGCPFGNGIQRVIAKDAGDAKPLPDAFRSSSAHRKSPPARWSGDSQFFLMNETCGSFPSEKPRLISPQKKAQRFTRFRPRVAHTTGAIRLATIRDLTGIMAG